MFLTAYNGGHEPGAVLYVGLYEPEAPLKGVSSLFHIVLEANGCLLLWEGEIGSEYL